MVNKLSFYTALMLCIPLFVWATGWHWVNDAHLISGFDTFMYFLTESGSAPYALITCVVFMLWLMKLAAKRYSWILVGGNLCYFCDRYAGDKNRGKTYFCRTSPVCCANDGRRNSSRAIL